MKTLITTTAAIMLMTTVAMADHDRGNGKSQDRGNGKSQDNKGEQGETGSTDDTDVTNGSDGADDRGVAGAIAPLGSLSFAAASASLSGDGMGFGLSHSTYGDLEGSVVFGFDINGDWNVVAGITTDFKGKTAVSIGVGVSF